MTASPPKISFGTYQEFAGWGKAEAAVLALIRQWGVRRVLEIGAGANPTLPLPVLEDLGVEYTITDVSEEELAKAPCGYSTLPHDFGRAEPPPDIASRFDLVFSRMVIEHLADAETYYRNIRAVLRPGGVTAHWFSTLYALPFLVNRLLPGEISRPLCRLVSPRDEDRHGKFPAYYSWSRGPTRRMIDRFRGVGYEVLEYHGYFGHAYFQRKLPLLHRLEVRMARYLVRHPIPLATSYAQVVLQRKN